MRLLMSLVAFFHCDRGGKLRAGPVWDFNLTFGNDLFFNGVTTEVKRIFGNLMMGETQDLSFGEICLMILYLSAI